MRKRARQAKRREQCDEDGQIAQAHAGVGCRFLDGGAPWRGTGSLADEALERIGELDNESQELIIAQMLDQTTIQIDRNAHRQLSDWKLHPREALRDVVSRLIERERERREAAGEGARERRRRSSPRDRMAH